MKIKILTMMAFLMAASVMGMGVVGGAGAADEWFVLSEQQLKTADPSVKIESQGGRWEKDVKQIKLSVDGADVDITSVVLHWDNRGDDTLNIGVVKAGGQSAAADAPGRKGRLKAVTVQYKILNDAPTATLKVWGFV